MSDKEINIKSSTIDKALELAKDFLGKLISPTIEEIGLLISENVKYLRFKNQVKILLKARAYVEKKKITIKEIPIKILVPLLENASLEDNESMQDKWATMLVNMVDSEQNLQNNIFPYLLNQISIDEFNELKKLIGYESEYIKKKNEMIRLEESKDIDDRVEFERLERAIKWTEQGGFFPDLKEFEKANLVRLGLIRQLPQKLFIEAGDERWSTAYLSGPIEWESIDTTYSHEEYGYRVTELGEKFIEICEIEEETASR